MSAEPIYDTRTAQIRLSSQIWESPLAEAAQELVDAVGRPPDPERFFLPGHFLTWYIRERDGLFRKLMKARGLDLCRRCGLLKPAREVQLVLVHESRIAPANVVGASDNFETALGSVEFIYLCGACRVPTPDSVQMITVAAGKTKEAVTFRRIYPASERGGLLVKVGRGFRPDLPGVRLTPVTSGSEPARCLTQALADAVGLPSMLHVDQSGTTHMIMLDSPGGRLPLILREELAEADAGVANS